MSGLSNPFDTSHALQPTEVEEQSDLQALAQSLRMATGFQLYFVRCNQPEHRQRLFAALQTQLPNVQIREVGFDTEIAHLLDELSKRLKPPLPDSVFVSGLEYSITNTSDLSSKPLIANLNTSRDQFSEIVPCPLVLWTPNYVLDAISKGSPDFFSIRSGVYSFNSVALSTLRGAALVSQERILDAGQSQATVHLREQAHHRQESIKGDREYARQEARKWSNASLYAVWAGFGVILMGVLFLMFGKTTAGVVTEISSIVSLAAQRLFAQYKKDADNSYKLHNENMLKCDWIIQIMLVAETITSADARDQQKELAITQMLQYLIHVGNQTPSLLSTPSKEADAKKAVSAKTTNSSMNNRKGNNTDVVSEQD